MKSWLLTAIPSLISVFLLMGCGQYRNRIDYSDSLTILNPASSNLVSQAVMDRLKRDLKGAEFADPSVLDATLQACLQTGRVLLVPGAAYVPSEQWYKLSRHIDNGGAVLFLGLNPGVNQGRFINKHYHSKKELEERLLKDAEAVNGFSEIQAWKHRNDTETVKGRVKVAKGLDWEWSGVNVETGPVHLWDVMTIDEVSTAEFNPDWNTFVFYAQGGHKTSRLVVECVKRDGSRYRAIVPVSTEWKQVILGAGDFYYVSGGLNERSSHTLLRLSDIHTMSIGISMAVAPQEPGEHWYALSNIRMVDNPLSGEDTDKITTRIPPFMRDNSYYTFRGWQLVSGDQHLFTGKVSMQTLFPESRSWASTEDSGLRWIPLASSVNSRKEILGWPASLILFQQQGGLVRRYGWIGMEVSKTSARVCQDVLQKAVERLHTGLFIYDIRHIQYTYDKDDIIDIAARWCSSENGVNMARLMAEIVTTDGVTLRRVMSPPTHPNEPIDISLGRVTRQDDKVVNYILRLTLLDARIQNRKYDAIDYPVKFMLEPESPPDNQRIMIFGDKIRQGRMPLFVSGLTYEPMQLRTLSEAMTTGAWLNGDRFDPQLLTRDLDVIKDLGINTIEVVYDEASQAEQLKYLIDICHERQIWISVVMQALNPLSPELDKAKVLCEAVDMRVQAQLFALCPDLTTEIDTYKKRCVWDAAWKEWILEQYGSVHHAEDVLNETLWYKNGQLTGPTDIDIKRGNASDKRLSVYKRFINDFTSRRIGWIKRWLEYQGYRQLFSVQVPLFLMPRSMGLLDLAAGAVHLDYLSPSPTMLYGDPEQFNALGFVTAYTRAVSDGKPVIWINPGWSVGKQPGAIDLAMQGYYYREFFDMIFSSDADGVISRRYPAGYNSSLHEDRGIINPDISWRPAADAIKQFNHQLRELVRKATPVWKTNVVECEYYSEGLHNLWWTQAIDDVKSEEQGGVLEFRLTDFGKKTTQLTPISIAGGAYTSPAPIVWANAEWGNVYSNNQRIQRGISGELNAHVRDHITCDVINTGPATWVASQNDRAQTVWIMAKRNGANPVYLAVETTSFGQHAEVKWIPSDVGTWYLRPYLKDVGAFGEGLVVEVRNR